MRWVRDEQLEAVSEKIRAGVPVSFIEAIPAIDYQSARQQHARANTWWRRLLRALKRPTPPDPDHA